MGELEADAATEIVLVCKKVVEVLCVNVDECDLSCDKVADRFCVIVDVVGGEGVWVWGDRECDSVRGDEFVGGSDSDGV